jgi:hypothetical protein
VSGQSVERDACLTDIEWAFVATYMDGASTKQKAALRGYLNDRMAERVLTARMEIRNVLSDFEFAVEIATGTSLEVNDVADVLTLAVESTYPEPPRAIRPEASAS